MTQDVVSALRVALDPADLRGLFPGELADRLRQIFAEVVRQFAVTTLTLEQRQAILDGCRSFYDQVIRPLDLPYVPAVVESIVDDWIWYGVESVARKILQLA
ncbi:MAG TPA: hypothetical protein DCQ98_06015 [Planctomycetaceae bacterium]|nr:hypothetical protein [Planctomycetaceae bacterium]HRF01683.1 hypothetical protein [Pirellulaceae bacterium]